MAGMLSRLMRHGRQRIVDDFHKLYYNTNERTWSSTRWLGVPAEKCPLDLWIYQELLHEIRPARVIETGTMEGGSAFYLASICDLIGAGKIMTVDSVHREGRPSHERILYYTGSSTEPETIRAVNEFVAGEAPVVVFLDSDHSKSHVLKELRLYSEIVTVGSYLVVEDGNVNGHPVVPKFGPGPMEAIQEFLASDSRFQVDADREKFYVTFNPSGYLKRIA